MTKKQYVFDPGECIAHLSILISTIRTLSKNYYVPKGIMRCVAAAERFKNDMEKYLGNM